MSPETVTSGTKREHSGDISDEAARRVSRRVEETLNERNTTNAETENWKEIMERVILKDLWSDDMQVMDKAMDDLDSVL